MAASKPGASSRRMPAAPNWPLKLPTLEQGRREDDSRRTVPLAPAAVTMLRKHRATQKEDELRAGDQWTESGLVFTTELSWC